MATKKSKPPMQTIAPASGPNPEGLSQQALVAQRREADRRKGDTDVEFAPDPAGTERRKTARTTARATKGAKTTKSRVVTRSTATDEGAEGGAD